MLPTVERTIELEGKEYYVVFTIDDIEENPYIYKTEVYVWARGNDWVEELAEEYAEKHEQEIIDEYFTDCEDAKGDYLYEIYKDKEEIIWKLVQIK